MSEEVAQIKAAIDDIKEKLNKIEGKKGTIKDSVFNKVKEDYEKRLQALSSQLAGRKESLKETLEEMATKKEPLKSKLDDLQEQLEEIELRHSIGEYSDGQYESMSGEIKDKMVEIEGDLQALKKEEEETKELLGEPVEVIEEEETKELLGEPVEVIEEEEIKEVVKEEEVATSNEKEKEIVEEEPLPEVSKENMIAEELFTGKEETAEESESVIPDVSVAEEVAEKKEKEAKSDEELFDFSDEKSGEAVNAEVSADGSPDGSAEDEDWLSSLEQELNEEAEDKGKKEVTATKEQNAEQVKVSEKSASGELVSLCPKCNYKNKPDAWYCENCGSELTSSE